MTDPLQAAAADADWRTFARRWALVLEADRAPLRIPAAFAADAEGFEAGWTDEQTLRALDRVLPRLGPRTRKAWRLALMGCYRWNRGEMARGSALEMCYRAARRRTVRRGELPPPWRWRLAVERTTRVSDALVTA